jgi:hypothetical protein
VLVVVAEKVASRFPTPTAARDFLTPEVRAKMEALQAAKQKRPDESNTP